MKTATAALLLALAAACGDNLEGEGPEIGDGDELCLPPAGDAAFFDLDQEPCGLLSTYRFFADGPAQVAGEGVVPYDVNSALFSDYASKHRFLFLPEPMAYAESGLWLSKWCTRSRLPGTSMPTSAATIAPFIVSIPENAELR